ncbi:MAG: hypothetical protein P4L35_19855 [Ignavibacteriaceae bacterium]|nr:hypothetical protein [Ignavibacteriaceae bacterium]
MTASSRYFAILKDNRIVKLSSNKFQKLYKYNGATSYPEFTNKKIKIASYLIELQDRKPTRIINEWYSYLEFDDNGKLDKKKHNEQLIAILNRAVSPIKVKKTGTNIIDASGYFNNEKIERLYEWYPSAHLKNKLHEQIFN